MNAENDKIIEKVSLPTTHTYRHTRSIKDLSFSEQVSLKLQLERLGVTELFEATKELPNMIEVNKKKQPIFVGKAYIGGRVSNSRVYRVILITEYTKEKEVRINGLSLQIDGEGIIIQETYLGILVSNFSYISDKVKLNNISYSEIPYRIFEELWLACGKLVDIKKELGL